jgi:hypothetical protein
MGVPASPARSFFLLPYSTQPSPMLVPLPVTQMPNDAPDGYACAYSNSDHEADEEQFSPMSEGV